MTDSSPRTNQNRRPRTIFSLFRFGSGGNRKKAAVEAEKPLVRQVTFDSLLEELQRIWDEVGESKHDRKMMLLEVKEECLNVYKKWITDASRSKTDLLRTLANAKVEVSDLLLALGERTCGEILEETSGPIKEQLEAIAPPLEKLWELRDERVQQFTEVQSQIQKIKEEINGADEHAECPEVDTSDLSLKKLDEFHAQLRDIQKEKSERSQKVPELSSVRDLCAVLGMDFSTTITEVHPSLIDSAGVQPKSISNDIRSRLDKTVLSLKEDKKRRLRKVQELAQQLIDLWNLMDTPPEERNLFDHVTCNISATVDEVMIPGSLALDRIEQAEVEIERLSQLKAGTMKVIVSKRQAELEEIFASAHIEIDVDAAREKILSQFDSGSVEPKELLAKLEMQIFRAEKEALSRKEILEDVRKWEAATEDESWLDNYNKDKKRYNSSKGEHLNRKKAEKAQVLVNKIPAVVDSLISKTSTWEQVRGITFFYDGVPLQAKIDDYVKGQKEREGEKKKLRDRKK